MGRDSGGCSEGVNDINIRVNWERSKRNKTKIIPFRSVLKRDYRVVCFGPLKVWRTRRTTKDHLSKGERDRNKGVSGSRLEMAPEKTDPLITIDEGRSSFDFVSLWSTKRISVCR